MRIAVFLMLTALAAPFAALADDGDARAVLDAFAADLHALSARFEQVTRDASGRRVDETSGTLLYGAPDRFRWDYQEPFPQVLLADGERLWHYDESLEQVTVREQPEAGDSPLMVLTNPSLLDRFYRLVPGRNPEVLELEPLSDDADFERATLYFMRGIPDRLDLFDRFGQRTTVVLHDVQRNPAVDPAAFTFEIPEGVDVLEGL